MQILCATDLLPKSEAAIERAGMMAERLAANLSLLHVVVPTESERALEQKLQHGIARLKSRSRPPLWRRGKPPSVVVKTGMPPNRIVETIDEIGAGLVVLGPHRNRLARDALNGTIAEKVLSSRSAPVLIVKRKPRGAYRSVLLALDLSEIAEAALRAAESLMVTVGTRADTRAIVVHADENHYDGMLTRAGVAGEAFRAYVVKSARDAEAAVRKLLKRLSRDATRYNVVVEQARPAAGILRAAERLHPDLLVMGTRGHGRFRRALIGSVATQVLNATTCDVLIVPEGSLQTSAQRNSAVKKRISTKFKVGDHVRWNSKAGHVSGRIIKVHTRDTEYKGHPRHASEDEPQYEIKSDKTKLIAMHKGPALQKIA